MHLLRQLTTAQSAAFLTTSGSTRTSPSSSCRRTRWKWRFLLSFSWRHTASSPQVTANQLTALCACWKKPKQRRFFPLTKLLNVLMKSEILGLVVGWNEEDYLNLGFIFSREVLSQLHGLFQFTLYVQHLVGMWKFWPFSGYKETWERTCTLKKRILSHILKFTTYWVNTSKLRKIMFGLFIKTQVQTCVRYVFPLFIHFLIVSSPTHCIRGGAFQTSSHIGEDLAEAHQTPQCCAGTQVWREKQASAASLPVSAQQTSGLLHSRAAGMLGVSQGKNISVVSSARYICLSLKCFFRVVLRWSLVRRRWSLTMEHFLTLEYLPSCQQVLIHTSHILCALTPWRQ